MMKLLVVSNRLPITVVQAVDGFEFNESAGGLVSGLSAYLASLRGSAFVKPDYVWVGWPGITVDDKAKEELRERAFAESRAHPVFLPEKAMDRFYHGFCNKTIWPLFHYFPSYTVYDEDYWTQYKSVNQTFCEAIAEVADGDDLLWIHDYHLMLLPMMLREKLPSANIGLFLHIPFPSVEVFSLLPTDWRRHILIGLLGADLVGFHTHDYAQNFLLSVRKVLGYDCDEGEITVDGRTVKVDAFPMGIDFAKFHHSAAREQVSAERKRLEGSLSSLRTVLSIGRLDYTKGVASCLLAYEAFLEESPEWRGKVSLILVVVPSRIGVDHYQQMRRQIEELVGRINGEYGDVNWTPILYQYRSLAFDTLAALYLVSDLALITPLRDGMNLIAKEYIAARADGTGVLILSELAGAAGELNEAVIVNPNSSREIVAALRAALAMPEAEQRRRNAIMQERLRRNNVVQWAEGFLGALESVANNAAREIPATALEETGESTAKARRPRRGIGAGRGITG